MNSCSGSGSAAVVPNCYQSTFFLVVSPQRRRRRSKPSLITVNCMNPHPTNFNLFRQNIVFSYSERIPVSFSWLLHVNGAFGHQKPRLSKTVQGVYFFKSLAYRFVWTSNTMLSYTRQTMLSKGRYYHSAGQQVTRNLVTRLSFLKVEKK